MPFHIIDIATTDSPTVIRHTLNLRSEQRSAFAQHKINTTRVSFNPHGLPYVTTTLKDSPTP